VPHVHFHLIPKRSKETGLVVGWPQPEDAKESLDEVYKDITSRM